jgi:hypothetical protein
METTRPSGAGTQLRRFEASLSWKLLLWSAASMAAGVFFLGGRDRFWQGFGAQAFGWGFVDAVIAILGGRASRRKKRRPEANTPEAVARESRFLRRFLRINAGLDVLYVLGGLNLTRQDDARWRGHGWGIVTQGMFLLLFDLVQARRVPLAGAADIGREA